MIRECVLLIFCLTCGHSSVALFFAGNIDSSTTTFQQRFIRLLFFAGLSIGLSAFPCYDNSICIYIPLGVPSKPDSLHVPVTHHGGS